MTETTTPTEEVVDVDAGSVNTDLPADTTTDSAVESVEDTVSEESEADSDESTTDGDNKAEVDADLKRFAKSQGFDPDKLTAGEVKALSIAQKQVRETRKKLEDEHKGAVEQEINTVKKDSEMSDRDYLEYRLQQREMIDTVRSYWLDNPDDRKYEVEAVAILQKEKEQYGDDAMLRLVDNMPRLVREAKFAAGGFDTEQATEQGRKEERERLNKLQQGSADGLSATTTETGSKNEVTRDWIREEYDPSNPEHREKLDSFMASGGILK